MARPASLRVIVLILSIAGLTTALYAFDGGKPPKSLSGRGDLVLDANDTPAEHAVSRDGATVVFPPLEPIDDDQHPFPHPWFFLKDHDGNRLRANSTTPYSPRQTCGSAGCHDIDTVSNSYLAQHGRTDFAGDIVMQDDYYGDGRPWTQSPGRYGTWGQSFQFMLANKYNTRASQMDQTSFAWIRDCGGCHVGGGAGEYDRDGYPLFDRTTGQLGWELAGLFPTEVPLDGDYGLLNYGTGQAIAAPWDVTGLSEMDCLYCHRLGRSFGKAERGADDFPFVDTQRGSRADLNYTWRSKALAAGNALVDSQGKSVPAFAAAPTAGQGWFSTFNYAASPPVLQIDYAPGIADGTLVRNFDGSLMFDPRHLAIPPRDQACNSCHPWSTVSGMVWYDDRDVHYRFLNNLNDEDPSNDIAPEDSTACNYCHPGNLEHEFGKGHSLQLQQRNELDYNYDLLGFRTCRDCHLATLPNGNPNPKKHPDAPIPGTDFDYFIHNGDVYPMANKLSCQACHIPFALTAGLVYRDITMPMISLAATTPQYYSEDPLNPQAVDGDTKWYPVLLPKVDSDGVERLFPVSQWINIYWGDWDDGGTPEVLSDDIITPIPTWKLKQVIGPQPLPITHDDNRDGVLEINTPEEILAYIAVLKGNDANGVQVAARPVLVRGINVWYEDASQPGGVNHFDHRNSGIPVFSYPYLWEMDHNVLLREHSFGSGGPTAPTGCDMCHYSDQVFGRKILVDPFDATADTGLGPDDYAKPVYLELREFTNGIDPMSKK